VPRVRASEAGMVSPWRQHAVILVDGHPAILAARAFLGPAQ